MKEWNMALEQGFLSNRSSAHTRLSKEINSSSWN